MKLKNKKTGEIGLMSATDNAPTIFIDSREYKTYNSLAELCDEWEDYKEPKEFWHISCEGKVNRVPYSEYCYYQEKEIGNYFETKKEAELAVKKLKALKRLKDAGFKFTWWSIRSGSDHDGEDEGEFVMFSECDCHVSKDDLDLLFGGEE